LPAYLRRPEGDDVPAPDQDAADLGPCRRCGAVATVLLAEPDVVLCRRCADALGREALGGGS